jgi:carbamoyltransferase
VYLGLNISHDASAAILSDTGNLISAISEERISRVKNHVGLPLQSIESLLLNDLKISRVLIGTYEQMNLHDALRFIANLEQNPSNPEGRWQDIFPGFPKRKYMNTNPNLIVEDILSKVFEKKGLDFPEVEWVKHHDAHLGCALGVAGHKKCLLISLDGEGDGESGAIAISDYKEYKVLARISQLDSLGNLYTAVTKRYNFKPGHHEGKITGLAALGSHSAAVEVLFNHVQIENGLPKIIRVSELKSKILRHTFHRSGLRSSSASSLEQIVELAESQSTSYPDLAFAVQEVLEKSVLEVIKFWVEFSGVSDLALAGGVFANVKLNQKISELMQVESVKIFPNMGDGGLSVGGVWASMAKRNKEIDKDPFQNMYLAPSTDKKDEEFLSSLIGNSALKIQVLDRQIWHQHCANDVANGLLVAVHQGRMEFGPRALGNRTLLVDPRDLGAKNHVNARLKRTEFMPFAPVCTLEKANDFFDLPNEVQPFMYMTMTCNVRKQWRDSLPAITHVDGTARPQLVTPESNLNLHTILKNFESITGFPIMVNTSLNIHEEPINYSYEDTIRALLSDAIDIVYFENVKISASGRT